MKNHFLFLLFFSFLFPFVSCASSSHNDTTLPLIESAQKKIPQPSLRPQLFSLQVQVWRHDQDSQTLIMDETLLFVDNGEVQLVSRAQHPLAHDNLVTDYVITVKPELKSKEVTSMNLKLQLKSHSDLEPQKENLFSASWKAFPVRLDQRLLLPEQSFPDHSKYNINLFVKKVNENDIIVD